MLPFLAAAAPLAGPIMSYIGQRETNATNSTIADDANRAAQSNAREQMAFQERMSNTSHAREVADLKAAGLNPILSANAGASSPTGAAGATQTATMQNPMESLASSGKDIAELALQFQRQKKELEVMDSVAAKNRVDAKVASKGIPKADLTNKMYEIVKPWVNKLQNALTTDQPKDVKINKPR